MAMSAPAVRSTLDVVFWFLERGDSAGRELSARKVQCFLYLAQAHFADQNEGRKLMPATFIATQTGPIEPTVYHIFEDGRPRVVTALPGPRIETFLHGVWRRYEELGEDALHNIVCEHECYRAGLAEGRNNEVDFTRRAPPGAPGTQGSAFEGGQRPVTVSGKEATKWVPGSYGSTPEQDDSVPPAGAPPSAPRPQRSKKD